MVGCFSFYSVTYGPPLHSYGAFNTWVEWRHSLGVRKQVVDGEPGLYFHMLWSLGMFDAVQIVFLHSWVCVELLVCRKVHRKHFRAPPFYRLVGENTATHPLLYRTRKSVGGVEVFIEAASEGLLWRLGIEVDRQKSEWFGGGIGEEFVKLLQIYIRTNLLMNFLQLVQVFQLE